MTQISKAKMAELEGLLYDYAEKLIKEYIVINESEQDYYLYKLIHDFAKNNG